MFSVPGLAQGRDPDSVTRAKPADVVEPAAPETGLLGDWGGVKGKLSNVGIDLFLGYKADGFVNSSGGIKRGSGWLGNLDLTADFDLEKLAGVKGLSLSAYILGDHGDDPTEFAGDSFATSNIESPDAFKFYEFYLKQKLDERLSLLFGLRDLNADFDSLESSKVFINSAFGITPALSQTGVNGPSIFPVTALALSVNYQSPGGTYLRTAAFNAIAGDPNNPYRNRVTTSQDKGLLCIWEGGRSKEGDFKLGAGAWVYTKPTDTIDTSKTARNDRGYYLLAEKALSSRWTVFVKHGAAQAEVNSFKNSTEAGIVFDGSTFIGAAQARFSPDERASSGAGYSETALEAGHRFQLTEGLELTPDYQYVVNPGGSGSLKDAQLFTLRLEISF